MEHKLQNKKEIQTKIREFSKTTKWKNFLTFLIFVVIAFLFWVLQYFQQRFETDVFVPAHYTEVPEEIIITNHPPETIEVKVTDKGTILLNYFVRKKLGPIEISLKDISLQRNTYSVDPSVLYKLIQDRLMSSSEIKSISPERINIEYSLLAQKEMPVKLNGTLLPAPGYILSDSITILPEKVMVYGDSSTLDSLEFILTTPIERKDINQSQDISLDLLTPQRVRLSEQKVQLALHVEEYTEKAFKIPITCLNIPEDRIIRFFPSTVDVYIQVGLSHYAEIDKSDFEIDLDYRKLALSNSASQQLELSKFSPKILNYHIVPAAIEFLIEQKK